MTVRRSITYCNVRKGTVIEPTKRKKIRTVDITTTLAHILKNSKKQQKQNRLTYGELYCQNYYAIGKDKNRTYYDVHCLPVTEKVSEEFNELSLVCVRHNGAFISQKSISDLTFRKKIEGIGELHFHKLRHTYSTKLIASGTPPKDVQELLGHSDLSTTMNIHTHGSRASKRNAVMLLEDNAT